VKEGETMIEERSDWYTLDSSKLTEYRRCPRRYFFMYVEAWKPDYTNHNLVFGEAYHRLKEALLRSHPLNIGMALFLKYYREHFSEETDIDWFPKNPGNAENMAIESLGKSKKYKLIEMDGRPATEVDGTVPIDMIGRKLHFRIDAIVQMPTGQFAFLDHKTTQSDREMYQKLYQKSLQMGTYDHVISCIYGKQNTFGGLIELSIFRKKGNDFITIIVRPDILRKQEWLWNTTETMIQVEKEFEKLSKAKEDDPIMMTFPQNEQGCVGYNKLCEYWNICSAMKNPIKYNTPIGFKFEVWNPYDRGKMSDNFYLDV